MCDHHVYLSHVFQLFFSFPTSSPTLPHLPHTYLFPPPSPSCLPLPAYLCLPFILPSSIPSTFALGPIYYTHFALCVPPRPHLPLASCLFFLPAFPSFPLAYHTPYTCVLYHSLPTHLPHHHLFPTYCPPPPHHYTWPALPTPCLLPCPCIPLPYRASCHLPIGTLQCPTHFLPALPLFPFTSSLPHI